MLSLAGAGVLAGAVLSCGGGKKSTKMEPAPGQYKVRLQTTKGDVVILVHRDWSPVGADHFYELTKMGFYNGDRFFRALRGFVVQWGINGDPDVNRPWSNITIKDDPPKVSNKTGTVVFAKTGEPNSRSTQVFINLADNSGTLDSQGFTPFGEVIQGMDNVMSVYMDYGEGAPNGSGPNQAAIADIGNAYLEEHFPKLDYIKKASIVP
jgi:peptidyl-prolyl cis-trans isomerase A (cyclophilin A)